MRPLAFAALGLISVLSSCGSDSGGGSPASGGSGTGGSGGSGGSGGAGGSGGSGGSVSPPPWCAGPTVDAKSCSRADLAMAVDAAAEGATIRIPAGACTWTEPLEITKGVLLEGAGETKTLITLNGADGFLDVKGSGGGFRLSGVGLQGDPSGPVLSLNGKFSALRVDHVAFTNIHELCVMTGYYTWTEDLPAVRALFDHITYVNDAEFGFARTYGKDASWETSDALGSADAIFVEDSTFTWNVSSPGAGAHVNDGEHGARLVIRHNTIQNGQLQWHDTGSTQQARSTRTVEIYGNQLVCSVNDCGWGAVGLRGGTGVAFDNKIPLYPGGYENGAVTQIYRVDQPGGVPWAHQCDGVVDRICSTFRSHCSGGDHRTCGAGDECAGIGTCEDTCTSDAECPAGARCLTKFDGHADATGWPCRDQTGRGMDDPLTHEQASSPFYWWNNLDLGGKPATVTVADANKGFIQANRDYFEGTASFDGTQGVGSGPIASRPSKCSTGVAYWASDEKTLYRCGKPDVWEKHFIEYPYPHPLQAGYP